MPDNKEIIGIKVNFELNTSNGLRRVVFGLTKTKADEQIHWTITFKLFERAKKTDAFGDPLVSLSIEIDQELHQAAEDAAAARRLTSAQKAHALGPSARDAKAAAAGQIPQADADETIKETLDS